MSLAYKAGRINALSNLGLCKTAGRMEQALRAGEITLHDLFPAGRVYNDVGVIRQTLRDMGEAAPNLNRLRWMRTRQAIAKAKKPSVPNTEVQLMGVPDEQLQAKGVTRLHPTKPDTQQVAVIANKPQEMLPLLEHELGEASLLRRAARGEKMRPYSTHLGVEPHARQDVHYLGDPEMFKRQYGGLGESNSPAEQTVNAIKRRIGVTPNRPMVLGGRQEKAFNKLYDEAAAKGEIMSLPWTAQFSG